MRYRPFGGAGGVVSSVSVRLRAGTLTADQSLARVNAAVEQGVNCFDLPADDPQILAGVGAALAAVDRDLLVLVLRIGGSGPRRDFDAHVLQAQIVGALRTLRTPYLNGVVLDDPSADELPSQALGMLKAARASGRVRMLGVGGEDEALDTFISTGEFDLLCQPFNLTTGWCERRRLAEAQKRDMVVIGDDPWPQVYRSRVAPGQQKGGFLARAFRPRDENPLAGVGTYAFLDTTANWSSEEICLAYALTDLKIATIQVEPTSDQHLATLAAVGDREMPSGLSAQVEMARFAESA